MTPLEATEILDTVLRTVPGLRVIVGLGKPVIPPAAVIGPPTLRWEGYCNSGPDNGTWSIYLVSSLTDFAVPQLLTFVEPIVIAISAETDGTVRAALPGVYPSGDQGDLPAYLIEVEMELSE